MSHTCCSAGGLWASVKITHGWVAKWPKSTSEWLPLSSWVQGHDMRMGQPLILSSKEWFKPIIGFNSETV